MTKDAKKEVEDMTVEELREKAKVQPRQQVAVKKIF